MEIRSKLGNENIMQLRKTAFFLLEKGAVWTSDCRGQMDCNPATR